MKSISSIILVFFISFSALFAADITIMSYNIRCLSEKDNKEGNGWEVRSHWLSSLIDYHNPDIFGVQEAFPNQLDDISKNLKKYKWIGVGREDGKNEGEHMAIFYDNNLFEVVEWSTFWLSETPDIPGYKGWDADCRRTVTWAKMKEIDDNNYFYIFNTHFDHKGKKARKQSAKLIIKKINEIAGNNNIILTGDFNCTESDPPYEILTHNGLKDAFYYSKKPHYGPEGTSSGFFTCSEKPLNRIDFIFFKGDIEILQHVIINDSKDGRFPSDHLPVLIKARVDS